MTNNPYKDRQYLSFSSIHKLISHPKERYKEKVLWQREDEFKHYFTRGNAVHAVIEHYNNTGEIDKDRAYLKIQADIKKEEERIKEVIPSDVIEKLTAEVETAIDNYFSTNPKRCIKAEETVWAKLIDWLDFWFNWKIDGIWEDYIEDYKIKSQFTNPDNDYKWDYVKYKRQAHFYMIAYEIATGNRIDKFRIVEILTKVPSLNNLKKDVIIQMAKDKWVKEPTWTIKAMIEKYELKGEVTREFIFERDEDMVQRCLKQFNAAYSRYSLAKQMWPDVLLYAMDKPYE